MVMLKAYTYIILFFTLFLFYITNSLLLEPYMDEIFHFPQAISYFDGNYSYWHPKITTPPGLYLYTTVVLHPISWISTLDLAKIQCFRLVNLTFTLGTIWVAYSILKHLLKNEKFHESDKKRIAVMSSLNITIFPVLYFFNFLYYTDCGSTFFVLLMYCWHLKKLFWASSFVGAISLLFRQTNIVWIFFVAADESLCCLISGLHKELQKKEKESKVMTHSQFIKASIPLLKENWKKIIFNILLLNSGYIAVAIGFLAFVKINGSIALGDKEAHQVCLHIPQIFYFLLFFHFFASPFLISLKNFKQFLKFTFDHKMLMFELCICCALAIFSMSRVHPYLIADNRHFTFYIWKRILGRNVFFKYSLIPIYLFCGWSLIHAMRHKDYVLKCMVAFCILVSVVPQRLLEFRYFIIPYIMLRLHLKIETMWQPYLEFVLYTLVNFVVFYLFYFKTFTWEDSAETQRFMW